MNLLTMNSFSKSYTDRMLFDGASFHVQEGEKVGVIGANGMGKSTLLKMIAGEDVPDEGELVMANYVKLAYLKQTPFFSDEETVLDAVMQKLDCKDASLVAEAKAMLGRLGITDYAFPISHMSGGEQKRVALVNALLLPVDLLILDEPTNHLDHEMSRWLEDYLLSYKGAVVMVTHDRYFLDRVVDRIVEVERGQIYSYIGTYAEYVGQKLKQRNEAVSAEKKRQNILRKELAWLGRGARARSTKQKAHIQRIEELMNIAGPVAEETVMMSSVASRMGSKTIELSHLSKTFGNRVIISDFSYHFLRDDRIGIVGSNGSGKSTLLKMIMGDISPDRGVIEIGETIRIGYFAQTSVHMDEQMKAIDYVREVADYIQTEDGKITASALMERFLFDGTLQWSKIGKLSGGERRRLYLMRILMQAPNVLIFDEPTNDLDIHTLNVLEDYLDQFHGILMIVSHDRYFLDRVVNRIFAFEGDGQIRRYEGNYSDYLIERAVRYPDQYNKDGSLVAWSTRKDKADTKTERNAGKTWKAQNANEKLKFSFNEQREYDTIDADIERLEQALENISQSMEENATNSVKLKELLEEQERLSKELDYKMERWVYLNDLAEKIAAKNH